MLPVPGGDVLHVVPVLEAALDLEGPDAGVEHLAEVRGLVEIAHGEEVAVLRERSAVLLIEALPHPAELRALAAVRAPSRKRGGEVAPAAHPDAERAVHEGLETDERGGRPDFPDLRKGELAGKDGLREAEVLQELHLLRSGVVLLRARVELNRREMALEEAHVLDDEGVGAGLVKVVREPLRLAELVIREDGVERHVDLRPEYMRAGGELLNVRKGISGAAPRAEGGASDVDRVGSRRDGVKPGLKIPRGGKELCCAVV